MTLSKAPLALDGVTTPSSALRKGFYAALRGEYGVVARANEIGAGSSLRVSQTSPAGPGLLVAGGTAIVPNGYQSTPNEVYLVTNSGAHTVQQSEMPATSASTTYWLVCLVVGDPGYTQNGHPFMPATFDPAQLNTFQFNRIVLLPCSANTSSFEALGKTYPGLALARIAIPPNTATITDAMITDLRVAPGRFNRENAQPSLGISRGNGVLTVEGDGNITVGFGNVFPAGYIPVVMANGGNGESFYVRNESVTNTTFRATPYYQNGTPVPPGGLVRIYWLAA